MQINDGNTCAIHAIPTNTKIRTQYFIRTQSVPIRMQIRTVYVSVHILEVNANLILQCIPRQTGKNTVVIQDDKSTNRVCRTECNAVAQFSNPRQIRPLIPGIKGCSNQKSHQSPCRAPAVLLLESAMQPLPAVQQQQQ